MRRLRDRSGAGRRSTRWRRVEWATRRRTPPRRDAVRTAQGAAVGAGCPRERSVLPRFTVHGRDRRGRRPAAALPQRRHGLAGRAAARLAADRVLLAARRGAARPRPHGDRPRPAGLRGQRQGDVG